MLQQILDEVHNWFILESHVGNFEISGGVLSPADFLLEGQRFRIVSSALNDGLYTYHSAGIKDDDDKTAVVLYDEVFGGTICALGIPREVLQLSKEIGDWITKYGDVVNGPYSSESFGGYSYTKASNNSGSGSGAAGWQQVFSDRLKAWRKLC